MATTFKVNYQGQTAQTSLGTSAPSIDDAFWSDPITGAKIKEIFYGDKVKFTIGTTAIPDKTILNLKLFDYDGNYNPNDELDNTFKAEVIGGMAELEFVPQSKWAKSAKNEVDKAVEVYFELNTVVSGITIDAELPQKKDDYLKIYDEEVRITILIELSHSLETGWGAKGLAGHTAMAIGNQYFDYGPDYSVSIADEKKYDYDFNDDGDKNDVVDLSSYQVDFKFAPGRPWWGEMIAKLKGINARSVTLNDVISFITPHWSKNNVYGEVNKVEFYVTKEQANKILDWWDERYKHLKLYSVYPWSGEQCTTSVKTALQHGEIRIPDETQKPIGILKDLKSYVHSTSNKRLREKPIFQIIKPESSDWKP